jgi:hypothetical protein
MRRALNHYPRSKEITVSSRKDEKHRNEQEQRELNRKFEVVEEPSPVDVLAEAEARYLNTMTSPETAPEWARVQAQQPNEFQIAPREDVAVALATLAAEEAEALRQVGIAQEKIRAVLNAQLEERRLAEAKEAEVSTGTLPARLRETLREGRTFEVAVAASPVSAPSSLVPALTARFEPALTLAARLQIELEQWERDCGLSLKSLYVADVESGQRTVVDRLMVGIPATQANVNLVLGLLASVRNAVNLKAGMEKTLATEVRAINRIVTSADSRGPMENGGDRSHAYYSLEREIAGALRTIATVTPESVNGLWGSVRVIADRHEKLVALRAQHEGESVEPLKWSARGNAVLDAMEDAAWDKSHPTTYASPSPLDNPSSRLRELRGEG